MTQLVVRASDISRRRRAAKFTKTRKIPRNSVEILSNTCLYNIFETYFSYRGYLLAVNLQIYLGTSSLKRANNGPKLPGVNYVAKNWALAMMLKALPLVQFWSVLLLKEQMMTSVRKTLKTLVWSAQNRSISNEVFPEITTKSAFFDRLIFSWVCPENSCEIGWFFGEFAPKKPAKLDFFSVTYQKPCIVWYDPSDLKISWIEVSINLEVNWSLFCLSDLTHFLWWKQSRFTLLT